MNQLVFKGLLFLLCLGSVSASSLANNTPDPYLRKEFKKTIQKVFDITANGTVDIEHIFGKANINTWDQNKVKIDVKITVNAKTQASADEVFDRIKIKLSGQPNRVQATTEVESQSKGWNWWGDGKNSSKFDIDYEVYLPKTNRLFLEIKHGEAFVAELANQGKVESHHSNIRMDGFLGDLELEVAHGSAMLVKAKDIKVDARHSNLRIKEGNIIELDSRHSNVKIDQAASFDGESAHDNFELGKVKALKGEFKHSNVDVDKVENLMMEARYSEVDVEMVAKRAKCSFAFGGLNIDLLSRDFDELYFEGEHADIRVEVEEGASYELDAYVEHCSMNYPRDLNVSYEKEKTTEKTLKGVLGNSGSEKLIKVRIEHGRMKVE